MNNDFDLTIAEVIKKYGLLRNRHHSKALGQHFLCDESLLDKIVKTAGSLEGADIVEVGPGPCGLTRSILKLSPDSSKIYCIEKDENLKDLHNNLKSYTKRDLNFIYEDALKICPQKLTDRDIVIISNLPYNVGTQIYLNFLSNLERVRCMVLMFQKEVVDRICAVPGSKDYGRLSIISQLLTKPEKIFEVSNHAFFPPPKVKSSIVRVVPQGEACYMSIRKLEILTSYCFQNRRKTIFSTLKKFYKNSEEALQISNIDPKARPETISPKEFLKLSEILV